MLSRIESEKDFRSQELIEVMRAAAADKFQMLKNPNETSLAIGSAHRSNRKYKGADENSLAAQLRSLDRKEKFYLVESQPGFEWHGMERHRVFRWSGPDNVSIVDLPIAGVIVRSAISHEDERGSLSGGFRRELAMT
jgi:hypothetical protein